MGVCGEAKPICSLYNDLSGSTLHSQSVLRTKDGGVIRICHSCQAVDACEHPLCMLLVVQDGLRVSVEVITVLDA